MEAELATLVPIPLVAVTVKVYGVPLVSPVTMHESDDDGAEHVCPPAPDAETVYCVIGLPPSLPGATHDTVACALPAMAVTPVGAAGDVPPVTSVSTTACVALPPYWDGYVTCKVLPFATKVAPWVNPEKVPVAVAEPLSETRT